MKNIQEAAKYIVQNLQNIDDKEKFDDVDEEIIIDGIKESLLDKVEDKLDQDDLDVLEQNMDTENFVEEYLQRRFPNFEELLDRTVEEVLTDYLVDSEIPTKE
jgi:hypothetical protein